MWRRQFLTVLCLSYSLSAAAQNATFTVSNTTPNCKDSSERDHRICLPDPTKRVETFDVTVTSRNGNRSDIVSQGVDPSAPSCVVIRTAVSPHGEDCFLGICNCKGRGWIELRVQITPQR
jgi:hypothetical protein